MAKVMNVADTDSFESDRIAAGFETRGGFNLALPEKALLDAIYLRKAIPFRDEPDLDLLDKRRLDRLANDFPGQTRKLIH